MLNRCLIFCLLSFLTTLSFALGSSIEEKILYNNNPKKFQRERELANIHQGVKIFTLDEIEKMKNNIFAKSSLPKNLYIIGHRGMGLSSILGKDYVDVIPENTIESFKQAIMLGADGIEFDVFITKDGHSVIIHDDELWKNIYGIDRDGIELPECETKDTFRVSKKRLSDLLKLSVGPDGQKLPTLTEVFDLVEEANSLRALMESNPIIINIDFRDSVTAIKCFELIEKRLIQKTDSNIDFRDVYFTSPNEQALTKFGKYTTRNNKRINIVPQATTKQIFGNDNTDNRYIVKDPNLYDKNYLKSIQKSIDKNKFIGIDCVIWDVNLPLLMMCINGRLQLHAYASNFKYFNEYKKFAFFIYYVTQNIPIYLKSDDVQETVTILKLYTINNHSINREKEYFIHRLPLDKPLPH